MKRMWQGEDMVARPSVGADLSRPQPIYWQFGRTDPYECPREHIQDKEDREIFFGDFTNGPWYGMR